MTDKPDPAIKQLEADLQESRFVRWDAEKFLIERHEAKIAALSKPKGKWKARFQVASEMADAVFIFVGKIAVVTGVGYLMLSGVAVTY